MTIRYPIGWGEVIATSRTFEFQGAEYRFLIPNGQLMIRKDARPVVDGLDIIDHVDAPELYEAVYLYLKGTMRGSVDLTTFLQEVLG